jgi:hypothetical protein
MTIESKSTRALYRGVTGDLHRRSGGRLVPKAVGTFAYTFKYNEPGVKYNSGAVYGASPTNAVIRHQLNQESFPTSGVSTTPHLDRAKLYARGRGGTESGVVYRIDRALLAIHGVTEYAVSEYAKQPSVPEDEEVILVGADSGPLPDAIVVEVVEVEGP